MKRRQIFRAQASKSQTGSSARRFTNSGPVLPFNPASIAGCQLWLDAADSSSILLSGSSNVSLWIDKSNTGTTAIPTRGATANQITYTTLGGYSGIYINNNGSALYNSSTYSQLTIQSNFQNTADYSIFTVVNLSNVANGPEYQTIYGNERGTSGETRTPNFGAGMTLEFNSDSTNRMINSSFIGSGRLQTALISSSSALTAYTNTTAYGSATNGFTRVSTDGGALPSIGGPGSFNDNRFATGYFHEILVYNSVLTTVQRQKVEGYLANKWGLKTSLPSNHPYKSASPTYEEPIFVPTLISGNQLLLDASDSSTITFGTGSSVASWRDKANNYAVANSSAAYQPVYSQGTIRFNGLSSISYLDIPTLTIGSSAFSIFFIIKNTSTTTEPGNAWAPHFFWPLSGSGFLSINGWIDTNLQGINNNIRYTLLKNQYYVISYTFGLTSNFEELYVNGTSVGTYQKSSSYEASLYRIGAINTTNIQASFDGNIGEILVYNTALTSSQRKRVEGYLAQKWGLQSSLPANHSYKTIAPIGIPRSITIQSVSALFTASNNSSLSIPASSVLTLGTNDHTIEFWIYQTSRNQYAVPFIYGNTTSTATNNYYMDGGSDYLGFVIGNGSGGWAVNINGGTVPNLNTWNHYAIVRNGTTFTFYVNGISRASATSSINITAQGDVFKIGNSTIYPINGYISNFRLVNGTAVYTSNFTPPTSPLTAIPNTQILIQGLVDRSPNAFTVTNNGGVALSTSVSPFV